MTRPTYDPLRAPAPRFPRHRFEAAGLSEDVVNRLAEQYGEMDYGERVRFFRDASRVPNDELARRYAEGADAGPSPQMLTPADLADQLKLDQLRHAAKEAGLSAGGSKVDIATRLTEAGATGDLPIITQEQAAADAARQQQPAAAETANQPPAPDATDGQAVVELADGTTATGTIPPEAATSPPSAPQSAQEATPAPEVPQASGEPTAAPEAAPGDAPVANPPVATPPPPPETPAPETPAAPADGTTTPDGGTPQ